MTARKLLVTSALPYANGSIHIGHLVEHVQTDIFVRFQKLIGNTCYYLCADDAHGTAIMLSAEKEGVTPEAFIDRIKQEHLRDFEGFHIDYDEYYTTHSPENKAHSEDIFNKAKDAGAIYTKKIDQYYCEETNLFLSDRFIKGTCPHCHAEDQYGDACEKCYATYSPTQLIDPKSVYSGKTPVLKSSVHYFFDLKSFESMIKDWLNGPHVTDAIRNKLEEWFKEGLKDWDISRDAPYFGFKIPGEDQKYFYVWLDAPIGYISTTQKWCDDQQKESFDTIWRSGDFEIHHFIGKDILYFHTLFWPAMLHVADYQLPTRVNVHGFLTVNGEKMSKSRGTFILARTFLEHCNPEFLRYYYASKLTPSMDDCDFSIDDFVVKINSDVLGKVINIGSRLGSILHKKCDGKLTDIPVQGHELLDNIREKAKSIYEHYDSLNYSKAMKEIMACADMANQYIDANAPWSVCKEDPEKAAQICTAGLNALRYCTIYLKPVLPKIAQKIELFLKSSPLKWEDLKTVLEQHAINPYEHIAKRLQKEDVLPILSNQTTGVQS